MALSRSSVLTLVVGALALSDTDIVNITNFPQCGYPNCVTSDQLTPSHLGCTTPQLTVGCLCSEAPTPLSCYGSGPSDQNNCWYELEDWFSGACGGMVPVIQANTLPECVQKCVFDYLSTSGCKSDTRNCFCALATAPTVTAVGNCYNQNCTSKMAYSFSAASWQDDTCKLGQAATYDQASYDAYVKKVHDTRIGVTVISVLFFFVIVVWGCSVAERESGAGASIIAVACVILLIILVPVYTAL